MATFESFTHTSFPVGVVRLTKKEAVQLIDQLVQELANTGIEACTISIRDPLDYREVKKIVFHIESQPSPRGI